MASSASAAVPRAAPTKPRSTASTPLARRAMTGSVRMPLAAAFATAASAVCLGPVFLTGAWFLPTIGAVLAVGIGAELARRLSGSRLTAPVGGLAALVLYLLLHYAHDQALFGLVPTTGSLERLVTLVRHGRTDINRYAAPVGVSPGIEVLTVGGVGLVALLVDTFAVTWRRAALAGLPLLVLYTVPTAVAPTGVGWVAFLIAGAAFLTLLLTEARERVSRWGRSMRGNAARPATLSADTAPLAQVGRRVGAAALGLALAVPTVLPGLSAHTFGLGGGGFGRGGGSGTVTVVNPILQLGRNLRQGQNTVVLTYTGKATYLRSVGLDEFTGASWRPSDLKVSRSRNDVEKGLVRAPGLGLSVPSKRSAREIKIFDLEQQWLPLPYPTTRVRDIPGTWLYDKSTFNVFGDNSSTRRIGYRAVSLDVDFTPDLLRTAGPAPASMRRYLALPTDLDEVIATTAREITRRTSSGYDAALALQAWLRSPAFTYSLTLDPAVADGDGAAAITGFLATKRGYCVQFASAMAVMARTLGIPARVAVGFAAGTSDRKGNHIVRTHDLHAWPELYFEGAGWVPFEPTPGGPTSAPPPWTNPAPGSVVPSSSASANASPSASSSAGLFPNQRPPRDSLNDPAAGGGGGSRSPLHLPLVPTLAVLGVLLLLSMPALTRIAVRRLRWRDARSPAEQARTAWVELQDTLVDHGYDWDPSLTPRRGGAVLVESRRLGGPAAKAIGRLTTAVERTRYAPDTGAIGDLRGDVELVRSALAAGASRWGRARARLLPRSTRSVSARISERFADGLDGVDRAAARVTRVRVRRT